MNEDVIRAEELMVKRKERQAELASQFQIEHESLRHNLRVKEGAAVRDGFLQRIRRWYIEYRDVNGKFPDLPGEEDGGSKNIYSTPIMPNETNLNNAAASSSKKVIIYKWVT